MNRSLKQPTVEVCVSPALIDTFDIREKIVVIIDILRASTSICVALDYGAACIAPAATVADCLRYRAEGYLCAAERDGKTVEGFEFGNSPYAFMAPELKGCKLALTTTNGTRALHASLEARRIVIGAFANISALAGWLRRQQTSVVLHCAGWKNKLNLEDTIFAGALLVELADDFAPGDDAAVLAKSLYEAADNEKRAYITASAHYKRLMELNLQKDVKYCLRRDSHNVIPVFEDGRLIDVLRQPEPASGSPE